jgi:hypothetical protein
MGNQKILKGLRSIIEEYQVELDKQIVWDIPDYPTGKDAKKLLVVEKLNKDLIVLYHAIEAIKKLEQVEWSRNSQKL